MLGGFGFGLYWVLVRGFHLSYHHKETILFTIDPYYGNLNQNPLARTPFRVQGPDIHLGKVHVRDSHAQGLAGAAPASGVRQTDSLSTRSLTLTLQVPTTKGSRGSSTLYSRYLGGGGVRVTYDTIFQMAYLDPEK